MVVDMIIVIVEMIKITSTIMDLKEVVDKD